MCEEKYLGKHYKQDEKKSDPGNRPPAGLRGAKTTTKLQKLTLNCQNYPKINGKFRPKRKTNFFIAGVIEFFPGMVYVLCI